MIEKLRQVLASDERIAYALLFGSAARGQARRETEAHHTQGCDYTRVPLHIDSETVDIQGPSKGRPGAAGYCGMRAPGLTTSTK